MSDYSSSVNHTCPDCSEQIVIDGTVEVDLEPDSIPYDIDGMARFEARWSCQSCDAMFENEWYDVRSCGNEGGYWSWVGTKGDEQCCIVVEPQSARVEVQLEA